MKYLGLIFYIIILDQVSKIYLAESAELNGGLIFGLLNDADKDISFLIFTGLFIGLCWLYGVWNKNKPRTSRENLGWSFLAAGIFGNLFDRTVYGAVIDPFYLGFELPYFNLADASILIGVTTLASYWLLSVSSSSSSSSSKSSQES